FEDLQPGISAEEIAKLESRYQVRLPEDIKAIYQCHNGSRQITNGLNEFIPTHYFRPLEYALSERSMTAEEVKQSTLLQRVFYRVLAGNRDSWICLFSDGAGDGYWYDLKRTPAEGALFYNFTETATFTFFPSA